MQRDLAHGGPSLAEAQRYKINGGRLWVQWKGLLDVDAVTRELSALKSALSDASVRQVLVDTSLVTLCPESARAHLVSVQKELAARGRRTAWLDARAAFRGMALWVMHLAQDPNGKAVSTLQQAEAWLGSSEAREAVASKALVAK